MNRTGDLIYIDNTKVGEISIWFDPNPNLSAKMASLEDCRFDCDKMCWITNFSNKNLEKLKGLFQNELVILASQVMMPVKLDTP